MAQVVRLSDITNLLSKFDGNDTIYASKPWTEGSLAIVATEPKSGDLPPEAAGKGMKYFLEVSIAQKFVDDWIALLDAKPSVTTVCGRLIRYATDDA